MPDAPEWLSRVDPRRPWCCICHIESHIENGMSIDDAVSRYNGDVERWVTAEKKRRETKST